MHFEPMNYSNKQLLAICKFNSLNEWLFARVGRDECAERRQRTLRLEYDFQSMRGRTVGDGLTNDMTIVLFLMNNF